MDPRVLSKPHPDRPFRPFVIPVRRSDWVSESSTQWKHVRVAEAVGDISAQIRTASVPPTSADGIAAYPKVVVFLYPDDVLLCDNEMRALMSPMPLHHLTSPVPVRVKRVPMRSKEVV